ncbi:hypothetical protein [uncultured Mediterranean phage]|nr:hypothetical protein [uncultured Mediterranean phage]
MHIILKSEKLPNGKMPPKSHNIYLFYFLDERKNTASILPLINNALEHNLQNPLITKIFIFGNSEKGKRIILSSYEVEYVYTLKFYFSQIQNFIEERKLQGYIVVSTPYTHFGINLGLLKDTILHKKSNILAINAFSNISNKYNKCADNFIFHSNMNVPKERRKIFNIHMIRMDSCSKILYLYYVLNYEIYNESEKYKCFSVRTDPFTNFNQYFQGILNCRKHNKQDTQSPFILMEPADASIITPLLLTTIQNGNRYDIRKDTDRLFNYVREKLTKKAPFVIPRIAGIENQIVVATDNLSRNISIQEKNQIFQWFNRVLPVMKRNAGILIRTQQSIINYASMYARVFEQCELYTDWPLWGAVGRAIGDSQKYFEERYKKATLWAFIYDLYHTIYSRPWTHALRGKRVLIISSFVESYKKKVADGVLDKIYGIDLFPECELLFLKPPQTQGSNPSKEFDVELERFAKQIEGIKDQFDVALCSCGGYGNLVCGKIFEMGKSAIYVGGVLQMYFGVLGQRWLRERPDIVRLFMNEHWSRPQDSEKPKNYQQVEGSCYW